MPEDLEQSVDQYLAAVKRRREADDALDLARGFHLSAVDELRRTRETLAGFIGPGKNMALKRLKDGREVVIVRQEGSRLPVVNVYDGAALATTSS